MSVLLGSNNNKLIDLAHKGGLNYGDSMVPLTHASIVKSVPGGVIIRFKRRKTRRSRRKIRKTTKRRTKRIRRAKKGK